ncbi:MAG: AsmA family protein [Rhodobacteraceae bacterium]|nr:AsmA family protein [Paracoccaceae bacterium]
MRWIRRIVLFFVALVVVAVAALFLMPAEKIAGIAADRFEAATGREMVIAGDVSPSIWPNLGVTTGAVSIANADWSEEGPMLSAEGLSIGVDLMALIGGDIRIRWVEAISPAIILEKSADGKANWIFDASAEPAESEDPQGGATTRRFALDQAEISGGSLTYIDAETGTRQQISDLDADISLPDFAGKAELRAAANVNDSPVTIEASIDGPAKLLTGGVAAFLTESTVAVELDASAGGSEIAFDGTMRLVPLTVGGRLDAELDDLPAVFGAIGQTAPALPEGLGAKLIGAKGDLEFADNVVTLANARIRLDQNTLNGQASLDLTAKPRVTGEFAAGAVDLSALSEEAEGGPDGESQGESGWSTEPIDASGLQAIDAELGLTADSVDLGKSQLGLTRLFLRLQDGRLVTEIRELNAYDGTVTGEFVVNSRGGLSVRSKLSGSAIALRPLLQQLAGYERLLAMADMDMNVVGSGNSLDAIMKSLDGEGRIGMGKGEFQGFDLVGALKSMEAGQVGQGGRTVFDSINGSFVIRNGVLINEDLIMLAPLMEAGGKGRVGIGEQTLNYTITPKSLDGEDGAGIRIPVKISGTWANPKISLDLEALAGERLREETEAAKERARQAAEEKAIQELGVTTEEGQSSEDAIRQELERRATGGLKNLLGGGN